MDQTQKNRIIFKFSKMVQISKFGCLGCSFDRKIGFFRDFFQNFPYPAEPGLAQCSGLRLTNFEAGDQKSRKNGPKSAKIEKFSNFQKWSKYQNLGVCGIVSTEKSVFCAKKIRNFPYWAEPGLAQCSGLRLSDFRGRAAKKSKKWTKIDKNRKNFEFSKMVQISEKRSKPFQMVAISSFGCLECTFDRKIGVFREKVKVGGRK